MRAAVFLVIFLGACTAHDDLALLELESVAPAQIEPGATLRIYGHGFPLGRSPEVVLRGAVHRPGKPRGTVDARLGAQVQSESLIEVPIGQELFGSLGCRATVDGELRVSFRAADDRRDVFAVERARIDFLPDTSMQLLTDGTRDDEAARDSARSFGLSLTHEELGTVGVAVDSVDPRGLAAVQGLKSGDTLIELDGMSLYSWRDFVPDPSQTQSTVLVARTGVPGSHSLRWPHEATERIPDPMTLGVFVLIGLLVGGFSPLALSLHAGRRDLSRLAWLIESGVIVAFSALLCRVTAVQWTTLWILGLGTLAALIVLAGRHRSAAFGFLFAITATLTIMLLTRTASMPEIISAQSPPFLRWYVFRAPASVLAFGAYLHALGSVSRRPSPLSSVYSAAAAVLGATLFLGGWPPAGAAVAISVLVGKSVLLMAVARAVDLSLKAATACSGLGLGLALLGLVLDLDALFPQWSVLAVGATCAIAARAVMPPLRRESAPAIA